MFSKVLVANRGEIALRIIRACRELGVASASVYSEADIDSLHVQLSDEAVCIGPGPSKDSYLKPDRIIAAAEVTQADAIHPGYGFLSENPRFAEICESCKIKFIGPSAELIRAMGDKNNARATAIKHGVPVTPGTEGVMASEDDALAAALSSLVDDSALLSRLARGALAAAKTVKSMSTYAAEIESHLYEGVASPPRPPSSQEPMRRSW